MWGNQPLRLNSQGMENARDWWERLLVCPASQNSSRYIRSLRSTSFEIINEARMNYFKFLCIVNNTNFGTTLIVLFCYVFVCCSRCVSKTHSQGFASNLRCQERLSLIKQPYYRLKGWYVISFFHTSTIYTYISNFCVRKNEYFWKNGNMF